MPLKHLSEGLLGILVNHFPVARNNGLEVPLVNDLDAVGEAAAVLGGQVPVEALHPRGVARSALRRLENLVEEAARLVALGRLAVLLDGGQVEHEIGLDQDLVRPVIEDELLVGMAVDILVVKVGVELWADLDVALPLLLEDDGEWVVVDVGITRLLGTLFREALGADELGTRIPLGPFRHEDVVLKVGRHNVAHLAAELSDLGACVFREGDRRKDGQLARGKPDCKS